MEQRIHISNVNNTPSMCFDTGLDPRSFARTKMSQSLIEPGYIVNPDGTHEKWKAAGVNETDGSMRAFGPVFPGKRLDLLLKEADSTLQTAQQARLQQTALQAITSWIKAKMFLGETRSVLNPGASFVCLEENNPSHPWGSVFFAPEHISNRCLYVEGTQLDRYNCPDLVGMDTSAFCAGVMLYQILTGNHPYPGVDLYQDMREGIFLPMYLAAPGLDEKLAGLIQAALLLPVAKKKSSLSQQGKLSGLEILTDFLEILTDKENTVTSVTEVSSLVSTLQLEKEKQIDKEKKAFLFRQNLIVKTRRFTTQNKHFLIGCGLGLFFVLFVVFSTVRGFTQRLTTEGMAADTVVISYYEAFSGLNHLFMEACIQGADRTDINAAATLHAVVKQRQAYEVTGGPAIIQARVWKETGGELPAPNVFGVTDLRLEFRGGSEEDGIITYRADYLLWSPFEDFARHRSDTVTLQRDRRKHWRIIELLREEK